MSDDNYSTGKPNGSHTRILDWPEEDRPREKLIKQGADKLTDAELLAILIRTGTRNVTAVDIGKQLMKKFESLARLSNRSVQELIRAKIPGLQQAKLISLAASFEIGKRIASQLNSQTKHSLYSPDVVASIYIPLMRDLKQEVFKILLLDTSNHLLRDVDITRGTLNSSLVHPREVFQPAIIEPAASIILLHNHPSGNPEPSADDMQVTKQLVEAGKIIGIPVHDHIIIAGNTYTSFAEKGIL
ncbi:MAG: JAB domain-containing protein [Bacteroidetes bacterium]|nr:MAG: JAB domain-containing protein [Bacteroidota bacterium]